MDLLEDTVVNLLLLLAYSDWPTAIFTHLKLCENYIMNTWIYLQADNIGFTN